MIHCCVFGKAHGKEDKTDKRNKIRERMKRDTRKHGHGHVDESEKFKRKGLMVRKNRKRAAKILYVALLLLLAALMAACAFAYFIDK